MNGSSGHSKNVTAAAAVFFFGASVGASFGDAFSTENLNRYLTVRTDIILSERFGGAAYQVGVTLLHWEESLANSMVAIDRSGFPLDYTVTIVSLPEVPSSTQRRLQKVIHSAIVRYYQVNTYKGCSDPNSRNFDYIANLGIPEHFRAAPKVVQKIYLHN